MLLKTLLPAKIGKYAINSNLTDEAQINTLALKHRIALKPSFKIMQSIIHNSYTHSQKKIGSLKSLINQVQFLTPTRCDVNGCEQRFNDTSWISYAIPTNEVHNKPESCMMYVPLNNSEFQCLPHNFDLNKTMACDKFVYEDEYSLVKEVSRSIF